jgi:hypothetical protein
MVDLSFGKRYGFGRSSVASRSPDPRKPDPHALVDHARGSRGTPHRGHLLGVLHEVARGHQQHFGVVERWERRDMAQRKRVRGRILPGHGGQFPDPLGPAPVPLSDQGLQRLRCVRLGSREIHDRGIVHDHADEGVPVLGEHPELVGDACCAPAWTGNTTGMMRSAAMRVRKGIPEFRTVCSS